ncbi:MAG TPA: hypothetical protein VN285_08205 [Candidatus Deferrimicrobium sp.]|nr:hypothetical protein [Candidatus Deferrimicrobium sp.]
MNRKAFLLGLYSIGAQVLILRELVASLNGDELFIGTALFGWLVSVAAGAYLGGQGRLPVKPEPLFVVGAILLPVVLICTRLSPLIITDVVGEVAPFTSAAVLSVAIMLLPGLISGWLFPAITREGPAATGSIVQVYFVEGLGAFTGGAAITLLTAGLLSTLEMSVLLTAVILVSVLTAWKKRLASVATSALGLLLGIALVAGGFVSWIDRRIEGVRYQSYNVVRSFDTPYARETILSRDSALVLMTDNTIEATYPDVMTTEYTLIAPLLYKPEARDILIIGRTEFGVGQLADSIAGLSLTAIDSRGALTSALDLLTPAAAAVSRITDDPVTYFTRSHAPRRYDIVILNVGELHSYKNSRLLTERFLSAVKTCLKPGGLVYFPSRYDSDRYITPEVGQVLASIHRIFQRLFRHVTVWPGETTLFFGSDASALDLPYDSLIQNLRKVGYAAAYVSDNYLFDRLSDFKIARLQEKLSAAGTANSLNRPVIPHQQALYRAKADSFDRRVLTIILGRSEWLALIPVLIAGSFILTGVSRGEPRRFGLFLYFTAGVVSLGLELISFYVYQSLAGALYSEMAVLIGAFMLGLAFGTYYSQRASGVRLEYLALLILLGGILIFLFTFDHIDPRALLFYHVSFLFVVATATGSLFVAATNRYYPLGRNANPGAGYACELTGSALGALLTTTILLPVIGLQALLASLAGIVVLALVGSVISGRK